VGLKNFHGFIVEPCHPVISSFDLIDTKPKGLVLPSTRPFCFYDSQKPADNNFELGKIIIQTEANMENIMIVDDEEDIVQLMAETISRWGYNPIIARDGDDALRKFAELPIDLLLTDLRMPKSDGVKLLDKVKELDPHAIVILFTGYPAIQSAVDALKKGAYDYLIKPVDLAELKAKIERGLKAKRKAQANTFLKGVNWAMIVSIPFWLLLGIVLAQKLMH
jgi:CheY-like chemotaxis protein